QADAKSETTREATEAPEVEEDYEIESADGSVIGPRAARAARPLACAQGRVVDDHESPLAGARVLASLRDTRAGALLDAPANQGYVREVETDAAGRFSLPDLDIGQLRIAVRAGGFAPLDLRPLHLVLGAPLELGDLHLARGVVLAGVVLDSVGHPVVEAAIFQVSAPLFGPVRALGTLPASPLGTSQAEGRFELAAIAPAAWTLLVRHPDFPDAFFDGECSAKDSRVDDLKLVLAPGESISGSIAAFDADTTPALKVVSVPDAGLTQFRQSKPDGASRAWLAGVRSTVVDKEGHFELRGLEPGSVQSLRAVRADAGAEASAGDELDDAWAPLAFARAGDKKVELVYRPGGSLVFQVVNRASGAPIERMRISLSGLLPQGPLTKSGTPRMHFPAGAVTMLDLRALSSGGSSARAVRSQTSCAAGVRIEAVGYMPLDERFEIEPREQVDLGILQLTPLPMLAVRVEDAADSKPLSGASVALSARWPDPVRPGRYYSSGITGSGGIARLTSLTTSDALVSVSREGYAPLSQFPACGVPLEETPSIVIGLIRGARIAVTVRDSLGDFVSSASVTLLKLPLLVDDNFSRSALTSPAGIAHFVDLPGGSYEISVSLRDGFGKPFRDAKFAELPPRVSVSDADEAATEVQVAALCSLRGKLGCAGEPLSGAVISFGPGGGFGDFGRGMESFSSAPKLRTGGGGEFGPALLAAGDYTLLIEHEGLGFCTRRSVSVKDRETEIEIDVGDTVLTGRVFDTRGDAVAGALVRLYASSGRPVDRPSRRRGVSLQLRVAPAPLSQVLTDARGAFRLGVVPPGAELLLTFDEGQRTDSTIVRPLRAGDLREHVEGHLEERGSLELTLKNSAPDRRRAIFCFDLDLSEGMGAQGFVISDERRVRFDGLAPGRALVLSYEIDPLDRIQGYLDELNATVEPGKLASVASKR
ncbi:MAG TPA: carboxypeptidase-like regulatory domain-containing protein, partial [Planctomycetota bacterium]|nr:carboxypeptidase-like regulatory domain-containing protein [Planctomycetota bacterium]